MTMLRRVADALLWAGAVLGALSLLLAALAFALDTKPLLFRSGSMGPDMPAGSIALARTVPATDVGVGDVVSIVDGGTRITHRVVETESTADGAELVLQGDTNPVPDPSSYTVHEVDRVVATLPAAATVASSTAVRVGLVALVGGAALVLLWPRDRREVRRAVVTVGLVLAVGLTGASLNPAVPTVARWSDDGRLTTGAFSSYTLPTPQATTCDVDTDPILRYVATIQWQATTTPYPFTYTATIRGGQPLPVTTPSPGIRQVQVSSGLLSALFGGTAYIDIRSQLPGTSWQSPQRRSRALDVALLGADLDCGPDSTSAAA
ncbi:hypothetical protein GCM10023169_09030 [Georgenia halophila]|uniref:Signal peptidase I n=1 Tax=Georgenia halophila TaxID=620889 RepID=A0ABP8KXW9_9MICO